MVLENNGETSWTDRVKNEEVLHRVKEERNILQKRGEKWKANWIDYILHRNCLPKHIIGGKIEGETEVKGRRGRKCKQLLNDLKETKGYCKLKKEVL